MKRIGIIFNGSKSKAKLNKYIQLLTKTKYEVEVFETKNIQDVTAQTQKAIDSGCEVLVSAGGDGTLLYVVNVVIHFPDIALITLPLGTGNDFSKMLGIYNVFDAAIATQEHFIREVDIVETMFFDESGKSRSLFLCSSAGIGIIANIFCRENLIIVRILRKLLGNVMNYILTMVSIFSTNHFDCTATFDTTQHSFSLKLLELSKVRECGGTAFTPKANIDNAILDMWTISNTNVVNLFKIIIKTIFNRHLSDCHVSYFSNSETDNNLGIHKIQELHLKISGKANCHLHGEFLGYNPQYFKIIPQKLRFISNKVKHEHTRT